MLLFNCPNSKPQASKAYPVSKICDIEAHRDILVVQPRNIADERKGKDGQTNASSVDPAVSEFVTSR